MKGQPIFARIKRLIGVPDDANDCWVWLGSVNKRTGYGKKQWAGRAELAHRWVWEMFNGKIPEGKVINHKCGNRKCVNINHLEVVTQADNCRHGNGAKLTAQQVAEIRALPVVRGDRKRIAEEYGITPMTVSDIRSGRSWK